METTPFIAASCLSSSVLNVHKNSLTIGFIAFKGIVFWEKNVFKQTRKAAGHLEWSSEFQYVGWCWDIKTRRVQRGVIKKTLSAKVRGEICFCLHLKANLSNWYFPKQYINWNTASHQNSHFPEFCSAVLQPNDVYNNAYTRANYAYKCISLRKEHWIVLNLGGNCFTKECTFAKIALKHAYIRRNSLLNYHEGGKTQIDVEMWRTKLQIQV